jgi:predicted ATPase
LKQFESFTLDTGNECLLHSGTRIALAPKPFAVLRYLVENAGRLVSHDELLDALWPEIYVQPQVLRTYMLELRKILGDDPRNPRFIRSVPKRGYCFIACVSEDAAARSSAVNQPGEQNDSPRQIVGREPELARLRAAMRETAGGHRQFVFLTGEAGIGKTALVAAFRSHLDSEFTVAAGQCIPGFARQDYYPIADALRQLHPTDTAASIFHRPHPGAPPGELCSALEEIARQKPLALLLEDVQWTDEATLHLLSALARRQGELRLLVVATLAPQSGANAEAIRALVHDLHMRQLCIELPLSRLGKKELAGVLHARLEASHLPDELHSYVYQKSEGNPRFALTLIDHLLAEGALARGPAEGSWELRARSQDLEEMTPRILARSLELEIERLSDREQHVLEAASIPTVAFPAWMVAAALDEDLVTTEEMCDNIARRMSFIQRAGEEELPGGTRSAFYVFSHALYREVLYQRQSPARRALRHLRIARRLREIFRGREALIALDAAAHYEAAGDPKESVAMLRMAARRAMELRAYGEAADLEARIARIEANLPAGNGRSGAIGGNDCLAWPAAEDTDLPYPTHVKA